MDSFPSPAASTSIFNPHYLKTGAPVTTSTHVLLPPPSLHRSFTHKLPSSSSSAAFGLTTHSTQSCQSKPRSFQQLVKPLKPRPSSSPVVPFRSPPAHYRAASGYAAALIDSAQFDGGVALDALEKDARRLSNLLGSGEVRDFMSDRSVKDGDKGRLLKVVLEKGRFKEELKAVVNLLVDKGRFGIVAEVLDEFERIYGELKFGGGMVKKMMGFERRLDKHQMVGIGFAA